MRDATLLRRTLPCCLLLSAAACGTSEDGDATHLAVIDQDTAAPQPGAYTLFEADPVRPIAVLEQSGWVAVANTVDDSLQLFAPTRAGLEARATVKVGLRPVAVAVVKESRSQAELWVVNQLSDSVSIVSLDLGDGHAEVHDTLYVGDEPRDIVVAASSLGEPRVFVASAHRGQHHPQPSARLAADLMTPPSDKSARGLADVFVFDPASPRQTPSVVNLFSDKPRALAVGDGVVYAAAFFSGNRTTTIPAETVTARGMASLAALLAQDAQGQPVEQGDELALAPGAAGQASIEGGLPAVSGRGRCLADPRDEDAGFPLQRLCVETDEQQHVQRVLLQRNGVVTPSCQCTSGDGTLQPTTGVIVQFFDSPEACGSAFTTFPDGSRGCWLDAAPGGVRSPALAADRPAPPLSWNEQVKFSLPDQDVFAIGVDDLQVRQAIAGVGTILFGLAVQPNTGKLFVTNTEAHNLTRFEGHGRSSSSSVIGHLIRVVGPSFDLVAGWAQAGVPLKVAFRGIDRTVERHARKGPRRRPLRIDFCEADVLDVFDEWRRATGVTGTSVTGAPASQEEKPRRGPSLPDHLERALLRLTDARMSGRLDDRADPLIDRVNAELDAVRAAARGLRGDARAEVMARLAALDRDLTALARTSLTPNDAATLDREIDGDLASYRAAMQPGDFERAREAAVATAIRTRLRLPVLSFS